MKRLRSEIIDLTTGQKYLNESDASESTGHSRYYIHKSVTKHVICSDGAAFATYYYGIDIDLVKNLYRIDERRNKRKNG
jgi:hypothetical protein